MSLLLLNPNHPGKLRKLYNLRINKSSDNRIKISENGHKDLNLASKLTSKLTSGFSLVMAFPVLFCSLYNFFRTAVSLALGREIVRRDFTVSLSRKEGPQNFCHNSSCSLTFIKERAKKKLNKFKHNFSKKKGKIRTPWRKLIGKYFKIIQ